MGSVPATIQSLVSQDWLRNSPRGSKLRELLLAGAASGDCQLKLPGSRTVQRLLVLLRIRRGDPFGKEVHQQVDVVAPVAWKKGDPEYRSYLRKQIARSLRQSKAPIYERTVYLVDLMDKVLPKNRASLKLLSVGSRNANELDYIELKCGVRTVGLDLFSVDKRIVEGDMQNMPFEDHEFDVVYSSHSLEHSYDVGVVVNEVLRVVKPGGIIVAEVPINYKVGVGVSFADLWDAGSSAGLVEPFGIRVEVLLKEETETAARAVLRVRK
jgi:SAM-dependent methyltransferase